MPKVAAIAVATHGQIPVERWRINGLWGMHLYRYNAELRINGKANPIHYGYASWTPPGAVAEYRFQGLSTHLFVHLEWPEEAEGIELPIVAPLGTAMPVLWDRLMEAATWTNDPERKAVRVWDAVLEVAHLMRQAESINAPEPVRRAIAIIEERLGDPLAVADLAREVCVSHNHLTRLFRQSLGKTVTQTIQERRVARARHLLERSDLPIKSIASYVGLPDLQQFNKSIRKHTGQSPTRIRTGFRKGGE